MTTDCSLNYKKIQFSTRCVHKLFWMSDQKEKTNLCAQHVLNLYFSCNSMNNVLSYNGLIDSRMRASDKDLPVTASYNLLHSALLLLCSALIFPSSVYPLFAQSLVHHYSAVHQFFPARCTPVYQELGALILWTKAQWHYLKIGFFFEILAAF